MKLLLDEMWPPSVAEQLRLRGHDVLAVAQSADLRSQPDDVIFAAAQAENRVVVSEDVRGFRALAQYSLVAGESHAGLIFTTNQAFPRGNPRTYGRLVEALDELLTGAINLTDLEYWLS